MSFRGQGYYPGFEISPCIAARGEQTLTANKTFETFGRRCLRNHHLATQPQNRNDVVRGYHKRPCASKYGIADVVERMTIPFPRYNRNYSRAPVWRTSMVVL